MTKKLSIITINYNNLEGLKRTVESVINQTWQEFEYIVIDGGSTDGSAEYIKSHSDKIDYWVSEPDKGIFNAMNKGVVKATGEYLLFLNSGDYLNDSSILDKNHIYLKNKEIICFNIKEIREDSIRIKKSPDKITFFHMFKDTIPHQSTLIHKGLFERIGLYDENLKIVSDWKFFIIAFGKFNATYLYLDEDFSTYYFDGISSQIENYPQVLKERATVLETEFSFFLKETKEFIALKETSNELKRINDSLRKSRKLQWLIKLGLLNKF
jgi:glycosyltransferase involved in cell wall biosynthesis